MKKPELTLERYEYLLSDDSNCAMMYIEEINEFHHYLQALAWEQMK